ncbi:MAG: M23 family metallopeptidase, partial [Pseudomonadales bacterium]
TRRARRMPNRAILALLSLVLWMQAVQAIEFKGEFVQGGIVFGEVQQGQTVNYDGQKLPLSSSGQFVLGFDRDSPATVTLQISNLDGGSSEQQLNVKPRTYDIQRIEGIARKIMSPNAEDLKRIRGENIAIGKARKVVSPREDFLQTFVWPLNGPITGVFGSQRVYNGVPKRPHYGVDVAAPVGTRVRAPAAGSVRLAHDNMFYSGGTLVIDHGHGLNSSFLHLSKILVEVDDEVKQGQEIAEVGATGRVTGPHLDWRMNWRKQRVDPQQLVGPQPVAGTKPTLGKAK